MRWVIAVVLVTLWTAPVRADGPADWDTRDAMQEYYEAEMQGGYVLDGMGAVGLIGGGLLYTDGGDRARGAAYVGFGIGTLHLAAGIYISVASSMRKTRFSDQPVQQWGAAERVRMNKVTKQFLVLQIVEGGLAAAGGTLALIGHSTDRPKLEGAGYAIAAEAAGTLIFDLFASRRACGYRRALRPYATPSTVGLAFEF